MSVIRFPTVSPYGTVAVQSEKVFAIIVDSEAPADNSELLLDASGGRSVLVLKPISEVAAELGANFVKFTTAAVGPSECYVNKEAWVTVLPHPQHSNVCQVFGHNRYVAVQGSIGGVSAKLE